ncbi:Uncharacterised protein [Acinetobacter baumannii]|nr:Uncharacterised protein [Acinetobacter baumannii]
MELQAEREPLIVEGLMRAYRRAGQAAGAVRDSEHIPVPVQYRRVGQRRQHRLLFHRRRGQRGEAYLFHAERNNLSAQRLGDHLRAEANPEGRPPLRQALFDQREFMVEKIIPLLAGKVLSGADRPAEHHQQIGLFIIDSTNIIAAGIVIIDLIAAQ